ncbi:hypothetical protein KIH39_16250 [Telmatocola sphagniphila]|uniref:Zinc/iron-chelating domain-containing protein n=1 Tax=Telmatocola sphagniphila TaxID=1123043 RepID=A0A8E6EWQ3_9BACT|nr:hypothetical protein [Telmatocola sphagniphila]QVL30401.1 hypothetical protein KIH39_16250 [Telmatocola sphagniphila]
MHPKFPDWHDRIYRLYLELDAEIAGHQPRCEASGKCCRFREYGHTLFLSQLEAEVLLASAPPFSGPASADLCPYQKDNLCTAREPRPLGCRVYFCDPKYAGVGETITEKYLKKLKAIADEFNLGWEYAPLHKFLNEHLRVHELYPPQSREDPRIRLL